MTDVMENCVHLKDILPLLRHIDEGYTPTDVEQRELAQVSEVISGYGEDIGVIPQSISLLL